MITLSRRSVLKLATTIVALYHIVVISGLPLHIGVVVLAPVHKAISLSCALILVFLFTRLRSEKSESASSVRVGTRAPPTRVPWYDYLLLASALTGTGFVILFFDRVMDYAMFGYVDTFGATVAAMLMVPLLESIRRTIGAVLPLIILFFVLTTLFQQFLPGILYGRGYDFDRLMFAAYVGDGGVFGIPLGIAANIVIGFLIFGALMHTAGAGQWFMDLALALTGWSRGGPAKAAVISSAMFGSISGSPSGNAATTGVFTIPLMVRTGYQPSFAAAVEAVASTGGSILPPVMGAIAFIMAEWIEVSYTTIVIAAAVPALLYYLIVFVSVHVQAHKHGIDALPRRELPAFWAAFRRGWFYSIPIATIVYFLLFKGYPPGLAAIMGGAAIIGASFLSKDRIHWLTLGRIVDAFEEAVNRWLIVAVVTAAVGVMVGALELSGVGLKFSAFIVDLSGGHLFLTLLLVGIVSLIVGMGLDATPAYITLATLLAPAIVRLGVDPIAAHLFVIYWGLASFFTPPVCIAVFVTSGIAGSSIWRTGGQAVLLGIAAFVIPFAFVLDSALLLNGSISQILIAVSSSAIGAALLACGIWGYVFGPLSPIFRFIVIVAGLSMIAPAMTVKLVGVGLVAIFLVPRLLRPRLVGGARRG